jgi:hypothetical protein
MQLVEIDGCWLAVEVDEGNAIDKSCNRNDTDTRAEG